VQVLDQYVREQYMDEAQADEVYWEWEQLVHEEETK
jgi:hypothetical protein